MPFSLGTTYLKSTTLAETVILCFRITGAPISYDYWRLTLQLRTAPLMPLAFPLALTSPQVPWKCRLPLHFSSAGFFFLFQSTLLSFLASSDKFLIVFIEHNSMKHFWCLSVSAQSYIYLPCVPCAVLSGKNIPLKTASVLPDIEVRWTAPFADVQRKPFHTLLAKCHIGPFVASQTYISAGLLADKFFALF